MKKTPAKFVFLAFFSLICAGCGQNALGQLLDEADGQRRVSAVVKDGYIEVSWTALDKATGYYVARSTSRDGTYSQIYNLAKPANAADNFILPNTYQDKPPVSGAYYYNVQPYSSTTSFSRDRLLEPSEPVTWSP
ncbi:hypothetical protein AGMMS50268_10030 [Spirochaetia bacterium]|nr:hypothetical protein AGMMS50268_10030 [Spirochaetia bacterium]